MTEERFRRAATGSLHGPVGATPPGDCSKLAKNVQNGLARITTWLG
jgi:hypothetical protein